MEISFFRLFLGLLFHPMETFQSLKSEHFSHCIRWFGILLILYSLLSTLYTLVGQRASLPSAYLHMIFGGALSGGYFLFILFFFTMIMMGTALVIEGLWLHVWVYLTGGREGISATVRAVLYGSMPFLLVGWIPLLGYIMGFAALILFYYGIMVFHGMKSNAGIAAILLNITATSVIIILAMMLISSLWYGSFYPA